jgi:peroxiredoxin Q/BCP
MAGAEQKIEVGKKAPAFTLEDQDGKKTALHDLAGQWVVAYFYPRADTPGCTTEACEFTDSIRDFKKMDAAVLGISPDPVPKLRKFADKYKLKVTLLSDVDKKVLAKYGAWGIKKMYGRETEGVIRSTALIDPQGKVAYHWPNVKAKGHAEKVREKLKELRGA